MRQGHSSWSDWTDPKQSYDHAKFGRPPLTVQEMVCVKVSVNKERSKLKLLSRITAGEKKKKKKKKESNIVVYL